ncbi:hypothetical protein LSTR_LSTR009649 [Laodelphax striatellus]|uniref:EGF-like domain-containing protein n=1 Tax=Laodelphax striatellus TaxID=195883 RepID=A0A482WND4_LAOST|nr:hypothetical protein LSTR_LSTR009649 [Laodelphax striatellus]
MFEYFRSFPRPFIRPACSSADRPQSFADRQAITTGLSRVPLILSDWRPWPPLTTYVCDRAVIREHRACDGTPSKNRRRDSCRRRRDHVCGHDRRPRSVQFILYGQCDEFVLFICSVIRRRASGCCFYRKEFLTKNVRRRVCAQMTDSTRTMWLHSISGLSSSTFSGFYRFLARFSGRRRLGGVRRWQPCRMPAALQLLPATFLVLSSLLTITEACSSRSPPKPRPPAPTARPNVTFHTYACPPAYATWYCLNGATCFTVKIAESLLYNCECANGYMGQSCVDGGGDLERRDPFSRPRPTALPLSRVTTDSGRGVGSADCPTTSLYMHHLGAGVGAVDPPRQPPPHLNPDSAPP